MVLPYWPEPEVPVYRDGEAGRWSCQPTPHMTMVTAGYFLPAKEQPPGWMFKCDGNIWMSLTRMEVESQALPIWRASGNVVIAGLGMGFSLYNILKKPEVSKVTLLEIDPEVIALMDRVSDWRSWPGHEKLDLVVGDALAYRPTEPVNFLFADIWDKLGADEALDMTQQLQDNINADKVAWWGQELDFLDWCRTKDIPAMTIDRASYRQFAKETMLPVLEQHSLIYPRLAVLASTLQAAASAEGKTKRALSNVCLAILSEDPLSDLLRRAHR